jgi:hypothetical protein
MNEVTLMCLNNKTVLSWCIKVGVFEFFKLDRKLIKCLGTGNRNARSPNSSRFTVYRGNPDSPSAALTCQGIWQWPSAILSGSWMLVWPVTGVSVGRGCIECAVAVAANEGLNTLQ